MGSSILWDCAYILSDTWLHLFWVSEWFVSIIFSITKECSVQDASSGCFTEAWQRGKASSSSDMFRLSLSFMHLGREEIEPLSQCREQPISLQMSVSQWNWEWAERKWEINAETCYRGHSINDRKNQGFQNVTHETWAQRSNTSV